MLSTRYKLASQVKLILHKIVSALIIMIIIRIIFLLLQTRFFSSQDKITKLLVIVEQYEKLIFRIQCN